mgnify:CR=1 FL=1
MNLKIVCLILSLTALPLYISANNDKEVVPPVENGWNNDKADGDRSLSISPSLFKEVNHVYVYSEKQLDNLTIGITDMQGNTYHYEVTTIPACTYYAVSIDSLPSGQYNLCVYQGSNYVMGVFAK